MKILLKDPASHHVLKAPGEWTDNAKEAIGFPDTTQAIRFSIQHSLWRLQVVLQFNDGTQFVRAVVPGKLEARVGDFIEQVLAVLKDRVSRRAPTQAKSNPFARDQLP